MGELKANLNLSAREDGLNTENLSLATQDDANYAIDQIDKAINKDLKYMHVILSNTQYRKYLMLLNVTLVNRGIK